MQRRKTFLIAAAIVFAAATPVLAADTTKVYTSGLLVLLFAGFCALLIIAQLVPAILALFGMTGEAAANAAAKKLTATSVKTP